MKVDGIKQEPGKIFDTFLSVDIPAGRHIIEMSYEPEGLRAGAAVTAFSILCLLGTCFLGRRKGKALMEEEEFQKGELWEDEKDMIYREIMEEEEDYS